MSSPSLPPECWSTVLEYLLDEADGEPFVLEEFRLINRQFNQLVDEVLYRWFHAKLRLTVHCASFAVARSAVQEEFVDNHERRGNTTNSHSNNRQSAHSDRMNGAANGDTHETPLPLSPVALNSPLPLAAMPLAASIDDSRAGSFVKTVVDKSEHYQVEMSCVSMDYYQQVLEFRPKQAAIELVYDRIRAGGTPRFIWFHAKTGHLRYQSKKRQLNYSPLRLYRLELDDPPGIHYLGDTNMMLEVELNRQETEVVRWVPKPGSHSPAPSSNPDSAGSSTGNNSQKIAIRARSTVYNLRIIRFLCGVNWFSPVPPRSVAGLMPRPFFLKEKQHLRRLFCEYHATDDASRLNERSEFILHYLSRHYQPFRLRSTDPNLSDNLFTPEIVHDLLQILLDLNGLADRRQLVEENLLTQYPSAVDHEHAELTGNPRALVWNDDALYLFILDRSLFKPPSSRSNSPSPSSVPTPYSPPIPTPRSAARSNTTDDDLSTSVSSIDSLTIQTTRSRSSSTASASSITSFQIPSCLTRELGCYCCTWDGITVKCLAEYLPNGSQLRDIQNRVKYAL